MKKKTLMIVLILCAGMSLSVVSAKIADSNIDNDTCIETTSADPNSDDLSSSDAGIPHALHDADSETQIVYDPINDICIDTTNTDPDFDPLSSFDSEILDALRNADPETRIDYDPLTGTVTIPGQITPPSEIITETSPYVPDNVAVAPTAPVDIPEFFADMDDRYPDTANADPSFDPSSSIDTDLLEQGA